MQNLVRLHLAAYVSSFFLVLFPVSPIGFQDAEKEKRGVQVGQVLVTPIAAGTVTNRHEWGLTKPPKRGKHFVVVTITVKNISSYPNCTHFIAYLLTGSGKKYGSAIWRAPDPPEVETPTLARRESRPLCFSSERR